MFGSASRSMPGTPGTRLHRGGGIFYAAKTQSADRGTLTLTHPKNVFLGLTQTSLAQMACKLRLFPRPHVLTRLLVPPCLGLHPQLPEGQAKKDSTSASALGPGIAFASLRDGFYLQWLSNEVLGWLAEHSVAQTKMEKLCLRWREGVRCPRLSMTQTNNKSTKSERCFTKGPMFRWPRLATDDWFPASESAACHARSIKHLGSSERERERESVKKYRRCIVIALPQIAKGGAFFNRKQNSQTIPFKPRKRKTNTTLPCL